LDSKNLRNFSRISALFIGIFPRGGVFQRALILAPMAPSKNPNESRLAAKRRLGQVALQAASNGDLRGMPSERLIAIASQVTLPADARPA